MKTIHKILWQAALPLAFVACQNEDIITENAGQEAAVYTLQGIMGGNCQSRAQVELNRSEVENERFIWNREDQITLYDIDAETVTGKIFRIDENYNDDPLYGNPSGEATFITETPVTTGHQVTAVYPAQTAESTEGTVTLNISYGDTIDATDWENGWKNYMRKNMYMYAPATEANGEVSMQFRHLCAMARITYTNATTEDVKLTGCELKNSGVFLALEATLDIKTGTLTPNGDKVVRVNFANLTVGPGLSQDIYLLFFPGEIFVNGATLAFNIYTEGNETPATINIPLSEISGNNAETKGYEAGKRYWFRLMQTPNGLIRESSVAEGMITSMKLIAAIRDQIGENMLVTDENGFVNVEKNKDALSQVKIITGSFDNLEGIEYLPNLETLECWETPNHPLTKLDVSKNTKLQSLRCDGALTSLDVSNNKELIRLNCSSNKLTSLDLSQNDKLQELDCPRNQLTSLDLSKNTKLQYLSCFGNQLTSLDVSSNSALTTLQCGENQITSLTMGNLPELRVLNCWNCQLTSLDVSKYTKLQSLNCSMNKLTSLDVSKLTELTDLSCSNTLLAALDISHNMKLTSLNYAYTEIPPLDVSKHTALTQLSCGGARITSLDVSQNTALEMLQCDNASLTSLDISKNIHLTSLSCHSCHIKELDITNNPQIETLICGVQRDEEYNYIPMTLILTTDQKKLWDSSWVEIWGNTWINSYVTPVVKE